MPLVPAYPAPEGENGGSAPRFRLLLWRPSAGCHVALYTLLSSLFSTLLTAEDMARVAPGY